VASPPDDQCARLAEEIRDHCDLAPDEGPSDERICRAVGAFVDTFDFRYIEVIKKSVPKYRQVIVQRVNPLVRRIQLRGMDAEAVSERLVDDWQARNFVTAGGFAIEALAVAIGPDAQKSATEGVDLQRMDADGSAYHLYVVKSGSVTRNSDILKALKSNARKAEKILRGDKSVKGVTANYAIASGATSPTTFEDGVRRPSSQDFWAEITGLDASPGKAICLVLEISAAAGELVLSDAEEHLAAMRVLVQAYIAKLEDPAAVDWGFLEAQAMRERLTWKDAASVRHVRATKALADSGYKPAD
jgi:hypothetical protein